VNRYTCRQLAGSLIGQCLGDALGFPVEGASPAVCRAHVEQMRSGKAKARAPYAFGQYTDDSQLARELVVSWVRCGGFDPNDYAKRIQRMFTEHHIVGYGQATLDAVTRLAAGMPWDEAGTPAPSAGNGSAMRAGPVGLLAPSDSDLIRIAVDQGRITHQDLRCSAGAVAIAGAVRLAACSGPVAPQPFLARLASWVAEVDEAFGSNVKRLGKWLELPPEQAVERISRVGKSPSYREDWPGISPFVVGSVLWALYAFLRTPDDYEETIATAIAVGGDVDTTAAMAGAISGAHVGLSNLPELARRVNDCGAWGYDDLVELCERALATTA